MSKRLTIVLVIIPLIFLLLFLAGCSGRGDCEGPLRALCVRAVVGISNAMPCNEPHEARRVEQRVEEECFDSWNLDTWVLRDGQRVRVPVRVCAPRKSTVVERDCGR